MTPTEKATQLIEKYYQLFPTHGDSRVMQKQCADLVAMTVLEELGTLRPSNDKGIKQKREIIEYWVMVLAEIKEV